MRKAIFFNSGVIRLHFIRMMTVFLLFLSLVSCTDELEITVMTWNMYHGEQHYEPGKSNLNQIAEVINQYKPDFVALQEVDSMTNRSASLHKGVPKDLVQELARLTGMHGYFGKAIDYSNGGYGEGILSRFPVQSVNYQLPTPKGGEGRALLTIKHTLHNGQQIIFAGTHLCHQFDENRAAQVEAICTIFKDTRKPLIMGGDFNFTPDAEPYQVLKNCFKDAAVMAGRPQPTIPYDKPSSRIDYIFLSAEHQWEVKEVVVIRDNASDHMPVLVTLVLKS